jgi:hypothetical protein
LRALGWTVLALQAVIWLGLALLAWPDHLDVVLSPWIATFSSFGIAGSLLVMRRPGNAIGWVMLAFAVLCSMGVAGPLLASRLLASGLETSAAWADAVGNALMTVGILSVPALLALFPDGEVPGRAGRILFWFIPWVALIGVTATMLNGGWGGDPDQAMVESPLRDATAPWGDALAQVFLAGMGVSVLWSTALLIRRWRVTAGAGRQQIKWLAVAAAILVAAMAAAGFNTSELWEIVVVASALSLIPLAIVLAVLRYRLYDIDRLISRTVSYAAVVGVLGLVFLGLVTGSATFLPSDDPLVVALATLSVFALFNPLRRRVQRFVDRRFNRFRYDAERVVERFTGSLQDRVDPDRVLDGWVGVVAETMEPEIVGVWVRGRDS